MKTQDKKNRKAQIIKWLSITNLILLPAMYIFLSLTSIRHWLVFVLTRAPHALGILGLILLICTAIRRDRRLVALNAAALLFWLIALLGFNVPLGRSGRVSGDNLRVMTYNVRQGQFGHAQLANAINEQNPDILCVQEVYAVDEYGDPVKQLLKNLPGRWYVARVGEVATLSRYPITGKKVYPIPAMGRDILEVTLDVSGRKVSVLNTHLNVGSAKWLKTQAGKSLILDIQEMSMVMPDEMRTLVEKADQASGFTVVAGDMNLTPLGSTYRQISSKYQDAFRAAGWGLGYTCNASRRLFRIDHIFTDYNIKVKKCYVPAAVASDHRAVVADIVLPR